MYFAILLHSPQDAIVWFVFDGLQAEMRKINLWKKNEDLKNRWYCSDLSGSNFDRIDDGMSAHMYDDHQTLDEHTLNTEPNQIVGEMWMYRCDLLAWQTNVKVTLFFYFRLFELSSNRSIGAYLWSLTSYANGKSFIAASKSELKKKNKNKTFEYLINVQNVKKMDKIFSAAHVSHEIIQFIKSDRNVLIFQLFYHLKR